MQQQGCDVTELGNHTKNKQINDQRLCSQAIINTCKLCCISTTAKSIFNT